jgi:hypothetical protein
MIEQDELEKSEIKKDPTSNPYDQERRVNMLKCQLEVKN